MIHLSINLSTAPLDLTHKVHIIFFNRLYSCELDVWKYWQPKVSYGSILKQKHLQVLQQQIQGMFEDIFLRRLK